MEIMNVMNVLIIVALLCNELTGYEAVKCLKIQNIVISLKNKFFILYLEYIFKIIR